MGGGREYIMSKTQEKYAEDIRNVIDSKMSHSEMRAEQLHTR